MDINTLNALEEKIMAGINPDNLRRHLEWFSEVRRDTGGPGEEAACNYIAEQLREYGVPVNVHEFDAFLSYPRRAKLVVTGPEELEIPCVTHSFCASTGPDGIEGELTYFPGGGGADTGGAIALLDGLLAPFEVLQASRAGAKALIFANQDDVIHNMIGTTIWGTPTTDQVDRLPTVPAVSINRPGGEKLKALLEQGPVTVKLVAEVDTGWFTSKLPEAVIGGTDEKFVLVGAHYCSWEYGITDNSTGVAVLLEMARVLWENRDELTRGVRIAWWPGHSHGRYSGSAWYADTFFHDIGRRCIAYHNIDSPGVRGATRYIARHTTAEIQDFCRRAIGRLTGQHEAPIHRPSRAADQSFLANGVPAFSCYPFLPEDHPDYRPWTGGCGNAYWWHSSEDTLDKASVEILTLDTKISTTAVARLCTEPVLPLNAASLAAEITRFAGELAVQTESHLDVTDFTRRTEVFAEKAGLLMEKARRLAENPADSRELNSVNDTLMHLSRILGPVIYTKGGRFTHDPAEWSPLMRNAMAATFPALRPAWALDDLKGTRDYGFLRAQLGRELNRINWALDEAAALCSRALQEADTA